MVWNEAILRLRVQATLTCRCPVITVLKRCLQKCFLYPYSTTRCFFQKNASYMLTNLHKRGTYCSKCSLVDALLISKELRGRKPPSKFDKSFVWFRPYIGSHNNTNPITLYCIFKNKNNLGNNKNLLLQCTYIHEPRKTIYVCYSIRNSTVWPHGDRVI